MSLRTSWRLGVTAVGLCWPCCCPGRRGARLAERPAGRDDGVLDSAELGALQHRAADVQTDLRQRQAEVVDAREQQAPSRPPLTPPPRSSPTPTACWPSGRPPQYASAVYRDGGTPSALSVLLRGGDPGDVISALGYLEAIDRRATAVLAATEQERQRALAEAGAAKQALTEARARADVVDAQVGELKATARAVTRDLDRALGAVDLQLAQLQQDQTDVNACTAGNWRPYVDELAAAGVVPPPAAALRDPVAGLPGGLVPVGAAGGGAQPGAAQLSRRPSPCSCSPAETIAAVSAAMADLGMPYAPGPEAFDCGSLVASASAAAGLALPGDQSGLFSVTAPVAAADVLPGDLVFLGSAESDLSHVGIALDPATMVAADARAGAVVVRTLPADQVLGIGGPAWPSAHRCRRRAPGRRAARRVRQHRPPGQLRRDAGLGRLSQRPRPAQRAVPALSRRPPTALRCRAAYRAMSAAAQAALGAPICITDSYRAYASQVRLYGEMPALAAVPGTSNRGWSLVVDLCGGIDSFGTAQYAWMVAYVGRFGFVHPTRCRWLPLASAAFGPQGEKGSRRAHRLRHLHRPRARL
ncbi:NlpC/P60 family protein [Modestobacter sp. DSM 44400]|uniref:M15 family metallopeptidase n=1 Tax=Modestobacter sp. DSM 44400 TaxID=1550230 RepID=UPI00089BCAA4|nr:NlpC/P60 family protein [Modestobacter sp. DSM 44400]